MQFSAFDIFTVGIGPSSSHTVGPMRAALMFAAELERAGHLEQVQRVEIDAYGSLAATGLGHGTDAALLLGLEGESPETVDTDSVADRCAAIRARGAVELLGSRRVPFDPALDLRWRTGVVLPLHPNGLVFSATDASSRTLSRRTYFSVGGGTVQEGEAAGDGDRPSARPEPLCPFESGGELLQACSDRSLRISQVVMLNELTWRSEAEIRSGVLHLWRVMRDGIARGCERDGPLPGPIGLRRRAPDLKRRLSPLGRSPQVLRELDLVNLHALAVAEENASGGRVVTAPTNGAAGVVPAVLHFASRTVPAFGPEHVVDFLLTAAAIGILFKANASISAAEVGCQGEIGVACSMAAAGLVEVLGGTPAQVEAAAEIGMEHHLGLTCDPVAGLVQVPCIERNAMGAVAALNAAALALAGSGEHSVSLDGVISAMHQTGKDMHCKYRETARGGLASL